MGNFQISDPKKYSKPVHFSEMNVFIWKSGVAIYSHAYTRVLLTTEMNRNEHQNETPI